MTHDDCAARFRAEGVALLLMCVTVLSAQRPSINYDEKKVPDYELPDPLRLENGKKVESAEHWSKLRRPEIRALFERDVYGKAPSEACAMRFVLGSVDKAALGGKATRKQVSIQLGEKDHVLHLDLLIYLPKGGKGPFPAFLGLNFYGNHSIHEDPGIRLSTRWMRNRKGKGVVDNRATENSRAASKSRWPVERILERGYALATMYYGDIDPDYDDGFQNGVHSLFDAQVSGQRAGDAWGAIAAWAWGLSRAMDYLETDAGIDARRVVVMGHSRLGKTSLWAGARDPRFALAISNNSGCGGAALSRRRYGETVERINSRFPHWFCRNFHQFNGAEGDLLVDQHMLLALIAPRPVLICSAEEDRWADPRGEFLAAKNADAVYRLLATDGLAAEEMPGASKLVKSSIGYHIRPGKHDVKPQDWEVYMDFADHHGLREQKKAKTHR